MSPEIIEKLIKDRQELLDALKLILRNPMNTTAQNKARRLYNEKVKEYNE